MQFSETGLSESLLRAVKSAGYETATPIQAASIPVVLEGKDLIGCAQTGTGKTAAFTLPMLDRLSQSKRGPSPRVLVLSPTRELAQQIGDSLQRYGKGTGLRHTVIYGGVSQFHQVKALRRGVDTIVATPGRLLDLKNQGHVDLSRIEILVFDEADQMLDMGFLPDLKRIVAAVPAERQTLMFSATMPDAIRKLAQQWLKSPKSIEVARVSATAEKIAQSVHFVDKKKKLDLLNHLLGSSANRGRTLVFSRTKHGADKIVKRLQKDGVHAAAIHGNKSQGARNRALAQFKSKKPPVLIATDIAARGLDINSVTHVVNFDLPETPETYVHRIGRTGRAGAEGIAISFCAGDEHGLLKQIERLTRQSIEVEATVEGFKPTEPIKSAPKRKPKGRGYSGNKPGGSRGGKPYAGSKSSRNGKPKRKPAGKGGGSASTNASTSNSSGTGGTSRFKKKQKQRPQRKKAASPST